MGRAALTALGQYQARSVRLFDVDFARALMVAQEFQTKYPQTLVQAAASLEECLNGVEYAAQCSPVGMGNDESPIPVSFLRSDMAVIDAVYVPLETRFLRNAKAVGCQPVISGLKIVIHGGIRQIQHYLGSEISPDLFPQMHKIGERAILAVFGQ